MNMQPRAHVANPNPPQILKVLRHPTPAMMFMVSAEMVSPSYISIE